MYTDKWNETKRSYPEAGHKAITIIQLAVWLSCCLESDKCLGAPWAVCNKHKEKTLFLATTRQSWPNESQVRAGKGERDKTIRGPLSPGQCQKLKRNNKGRLAEGKWKISNQRRPVEWLDNYNCNGKAGEALELFCNRRVSSSEDIIWVDNTHSPPPEELPDFMDPWPEPLLSRTARLHNFHRMWSCCRVLWLLSPGLKIKLICSGRRSFTEIAQDLNLF